jgi:hypothetical protein
MMNWMTETYNKNSAAHSYWFGFVVAGLLYVVAGMTFDEISAYFKMDRASSSKGGFAKIRIRAKAADLRALLPRAILLGSESLLTEAVANKGDGLEKVIVERFTTEKWARNSVPFFADGDATINGEKVQIKLNGAELTNEKILRRYFPAA